MSLRIELEKLGKWAKRRLGIVEKPNDETEQRRAAEIGAMVAATIGTPGFEYIAKEQDALEASLLAEFVRTDEKEVSTWEQFVEMRGYYRGFTEHAHIADKLVAVGAQAEAKLERLQELKRAPTRQAVQR